MPVNMNQNANMNFQMMQQRNLHMENAMQMPPGAEDYSLEQFHALHMAKRMRLAHYGHHQSAQAGMLMDPSTRLMLLQQQRSNSLGLGGGGLGLPIGLPDHLLQRQQSQQLSMVGAHGMNLHPFGGGIPAFTGTMQHPGAARLMNAAAPLNNPFLMGKVGLAGAGRAPSSKKDPSGRICDSPEPPQDMEPVPPALFSSLKPSAIEREILKKNTRGKGQSTKRKRQGQSEEKGRVSPLEKLSALASTRDPIPIALPDLSSSRTADNETNTSNTTGVPGANKLPTTTLDRQHQPFCAPTNAGEFKSFTKRIASHPSTSGTDVPHYDQRDFMPLAIDEDANWLSEFQQFLRQEILEVFVATSRDVENRTASKKIAATQVGLRCRFCAHLHTSERASRSSAFPSSCTQIYQSFTMMLREHLSGQCHSIPTATKQHFLRLKGQSAQSASDSKRYWIYAAKKLGMSDSAESGIQWTLPSDNDPSMPAFGSSWELDMDLRQAVRPSNPSLVCESDKPVTSDITYAIVQESVLVHLAASERIGNRSCLTTGLPGMACRHCCKAGRSGLSRVFPARKRNLKTKVNDMYDHLRRCPLVPKDIQENLMRLQADAAQGIGGDKKTKIFFARLWRRLGHADDGTTIPPALTTTGAISSTATSTSNSRAATPSSSTT